MNKQKGLAPIVIVLLIAAAIGGYLVINSLMPQETPSSELINEKPSVITTPTASSYQSNTYKECTDNIYTNNILKFSFKCPLGFYFEFSQDNQKDYILNVHDGLVGGLYKYGGIYISVILPEDSASQGGSIYNYSADGTNSLLSLQVGETTVPRSKDPKEAQFWQYTREQDVLVDRVTAKVFRSDKVWEGPADMKEKRVYVVKDGSTYMIGAYTGEVVTEEFFNKFLSDFKFTN